MKEQKNDFYTCPKCGSVASITSIMPILDDVRCDIVQCTCGTQWRVYYKFENPGVEVTYMPEDNDNTDAVDEVVAE